MSIGSEKKSHIAPEQRLYRPGGSRYIAASRGVSWGWTVPPPNFCTPKERGPLGSCDGRDGDDDTVNTYLRASLYPARSPLGRCVPAGMWGRPHRSRCDSLTTLPGVVLDWLYGCFSSPKHSTSPVNTRRRAVHIRNIVAFYSMQTELREVFCIMTPTRLLNDRRHIWQLKPSQWISTVRLPTIRR